MAIIQVRKLNETTFDVSVNGKIATQHIVTVQAGYIEKLGIEANIEVLIEKSFEFLLEREPNTSILRSFDLSVIAHYFPDYEKIIGKRLSK